LSGKKILTNLFLNFVAWVIIFKKLVKYSDAKTIKAAYYRYVYSKLKYGILAWGYSSKENIDKIFKKQKSIIRIMQKADKNASCWEFFLSLKILTLPSIIILLNCLQVKQNIEEYRSQVC